MARQRKILVDFDGVVHGYDSGWQGVTNIPDPPVPGVAEALAKMREESQVYILSTRGTEDVGVEAIQAYLDKHGIEVDGIVKKKIPASLLIDDRAFRFNGDWEEVLEFLEDPDCFTPWNKKKGITQ
jgi:trehalose-6-phosphatase